MARWWQRLEADLTAAERALERQHQAAIATGNPWPPQRQPKPEQERRAAQAPEVTPGNQVARLDQLLGRAAEATKRLAAKNAGQEASTQYAACMEREAQTEPELTLQAQPQEQAEAELACSTQAEAPGAIRTTVGALAGTVTDTRHGTLPDDATVLCLEWHGRVSP